jgi:hypothetical protein
VSEKITAKKCFEEILPTLFIPTETKGWDRVIQYHITEEGKDGDYAIEIKNQQMKVTHGIYILNLTLRLLLTGWRLNTVYLLEH